MHTIRTLASFVKFEHTVFALPFAYAGMVLGANQANINLTLKIFIWVTLAMIGARTLGMSLNRIIDAKIDAVNPRTKDREIPSGKLSYKKAGVLSLASLLLLVIATTQLNPITRVLWPIPVALFVLYPYTKRFTWFCHIILGLSIGLSPLAAWLAVTGPTDQISAYLMWIAIGAWIAGFDVLYATADIEFDTKNNIKSIPARFGVNTALWVCRILHTLTVILLTTIGLKLSLGIMFWVGLIISSILIIRENTILKPTDLSKLNHAFFTLNTWVGVTLGLALILGVF